MTKSYNDPVKGIARQGFRDFIAKYLLSFKKPQDVKVACFPGAEKDGEEALEVKQVYDALNIPRKNILGLEIDPSTAERLRKANLGIEVVCQDARDFFMNDSRKFDIISLDYKGPQTLRETSTLECISSRQLLQDQGILSTVFLGRRESKDIQALMVLRYLYGTTHLAESGLLDQITAENLIEAHLDAMDKITEKGLDAVRDGNTTETINIFAGGTINYPVGIGFFSDDPEKDRIKKELEKDPKHKENIINFLMKVRKISRARAEEEADSEDYHRIHFEKTWQLQRGFEFTKSLIEIIPKEAAETLAKILYLDASKGYCLKDMERYSYTSNSGSPMLMDMFAFRKLPYGLANDAKDCISKGKNDNNYFLNPLQWTQKKLIRKLSGVAIKGEEYVKGPVYERSDLGSSYKPRERISTDDAIDLLRSGVSPKEIHDTYAGHKLGRLRALKARYVTVGKFGKAPDQK